MQASVLCPFVPWLISILIYLRAKSKKRKITVSYWQMSDFALNWWMKQSWQLIIWARRRKGIVHFGQSTERGSLVRDSCAEEMEPALESCMKIQRNSGDNGKWESTVFGSANQDGTAEEMTSPWFLRSRRNRGFFNSKMPGSKAWNHDVLAQEWFYGLMTRPDMEQNIQWMFVLLRPKRSVDIKVGW